MANQSLTQKTATNAVVGTDLLYVVLDPAGAKLDRKISIADFISSSGISASITATEIGYGSAANTLTSDPQATRDPITLETYISQTQGTQTASFALDNAFVIPILGALPFVGSTRSDAGGQAMFGVADATGLGGPAYIGVCLTQDIGAGYQGLFTVGPDRIGFDSQDALGNTGSVSIDGGPTATAALLVRDPANNRYGFGAILNSGLPEVRIRGVDQTECIWPTNNTPTPGYVLSNDGTGILSWIANGSSTGIAIGDAITGGNPNSVLFIDGSGNLAEDVNNFTYLATGTFTVRNGLNRYLFTDPSNNVYGIGNVDGVANYLFINDGAQVITLSASNQFQIIDSASNQWFKLADSSTSKIVQLGDVGNNINKSLFQIDDFSKQVFVQVEGDFGVQNSLGQRVIDANTTLGAGTFTFAAGDVNLLGNGTKLTIDDANQFIVASANVLIQLNSGLLHFNGGQRIKRTANGDADYVVLNSDYYIIGSASVDRTDTLPAIGVGAGQAPLGTVYILKNDFASAANRIVTPAGGNTIDGAADFPLPPGNSITIIAGGASDDWEIV